MKRVLFVAALLMFIFSGAAQAAKKNVVLFVTDDQGIDSLGCYGNPVIKTPMQDSLAADGVRFKYAFCTTASCSASRSVILTGLHNHANGQYGHQHHFHKFSSYDNIVGLPVYMNHAGYRTARCGKYHVAPDEVYNFQQVIKANSRSPVQMADNCKEFINDKSDKPFFLYICTSDPHRGGGSGAPVEFKGEKYRPNMFGNKISGVYPGITEVTYDPKDVIVPPFLPDTPVCRAEMAQYYQSVSRIDQGIGKLIANLKDAGVWEDTLFIYISDHGIAMPGGKTTLYEPGMRSPCLVRNPYVKKRGIVSNGMLSWVDLTPTILDFAGALNDKGQVKKEVLKKIAKVRVTGQTTRDSKAGQFHGRSFLGILDQENPKGWDEVFASHTFHEIQMYYPMRVVRGRKWKLIWNIAYGQPYPFASDLWAASTFQAQYKQGMDTMYGKRTIKRYIHRPKFELFDLENDPDETKSLHGDPKYAKVLEEMKAKLKGYQQSTKDPWIVKWRYE